MWLNTFNIYYFQISNLGDGVAFILFRFSAVSLAGAGLESDTLPERERGITTDELSDFKSSESSSVIASNCCYYVLNVYLTYCSV